MRASPRGREARGASYGIPSNALLVFGQRAGRPRRRKHKGQDVFLALAGASAFKAEVGFSFLRFAGWMVCCDGGVD